jgi:threonine aldolase
MASLAGVPYRVLPGERGAIPFEKLRAELEGSGYSTRLRPALMCLETTHNAAGGTVLPLDYLAAVRALTAQLGMAVHIDGARLFNAAVALGVPASEIARHADTVTFCLSKGLSAPVGSVLCGPEAVIRRARQARKLLGGTMRQAGVLAAAGIVALDTMVTRLADDHRRARRLAEGLAALHGSVCDPTQVATNIIYVDLAASGIPAAEWCRHLAEHGVVCRPYSATRMRLLTHADLPEHGVVCRPYSATRMRLLTHADLPEEAIDTALAAFRAGWPADRTRAA